jgi:hypothetical protein
MAQTEHLPIYKAAYDLCLHLEQAVGRFGYSPGGRTAHRCYPRRGP